MKRKRAYLSGNGILLPGRSPVVSERSAFLCRVKSLILAGLIVLALAHVTALNAAVRIKDITSVLGVRDNQLIGYGLVVGLNGTGDSMRGSPFTEQSLRAMLERLGAKFARGASRSRNVASVLVTATLPPFALRGTRVDVTVSSLGDATSLQGGTLVLTPLKGADGKVYAVAQGQLVISGFNAQGQAAQVTKGVPTAARIPNGAIIERELKGDFHDKKLLVLSLNNPDFNTAERIAAAINAWAKKRFGQPIAAARDLRAVFVRRPANIRVNHLLAEIGNLVVEPDVPARVVIDERTGTVVIGHNVRISTVAVTQGNLTVKITELPVASQPAPFSNGETVVLPQTFVATEEKPANVAILKGTSLERLVTALNRLGVKPKDIIAILQAIKSAGALQAELVVQ